MDQYKQKGSVECRTRPKRLRQEIVKRDLEFEKYGVFAAVYGELTG